MKEEGVELEIQLRSPRLGRTGLRMEALGFLKSSNINPVIFLKDAGDLKMVRGTESLWPGSNRLNTLCACRDPASVLDTLPEP